MGGNGAQDDVERGTGLEKLRGVMGAFQRESRVSGVASEKERTELTQERRTAGGAMGGLG
jgi:hypothetical protein